MRPTPPLPLRRRMIATLALVAAAVAAGSCDRGFAKSGKRLAVIGIDGMDPNLLRQYMAKGVMKNFKRLADEGTFVALGSSNPPQSPVAWSTFITGMDPGGHGVFDFLHRNPATYEPVSSTTRSDTHPPLRIPLPGGRQIEIPPSVESVRQGTPFWDVLAEKGIRADVYRIPAAYPIQKSRQFTLSDMGTPDLQGGIDGTYAYYTTDLPDNLDRIDDNGGFWQQVGLRNGKTTDATLFGPPSPFVRAEEGKHHSAKQLATRRSFTVFVDPKEPLVHIQIEDGDECTLREGEWSGWLRCDFVQGPYACHPFDWLRLDNRINGMVKFFLQKAHPELRLYCSPVNIDPRAPCMPISTPDDEAVETLCEEIGPFYTAGLAEETKGLQMGTFDDGEFIQQCEDVNAERRRMFDHALGRFDDGLLFFYFSAIDLRCHMMWRHIEPGHPARDEALAARYARSIEDAYVEMDSALGELRERLGPETPLIVLSDHGFAPFTRRVNLNQWLRDEGWLALEAGTQKEFDAACAKDPKTRSSFTLVEGGGLDRARTKAYAVGFNAIYLNLKGREKEGCVDPADRDRLLEEIRTRLLALRDDEQHGRARVVLRVDKREEVYHGSEAEKAPDLVVGYARGYGASDDTALGTLSLSARARVVEDNRSLWSGNHLMAPEVVPGVLLTNLKIAPKDPSLVDVTATMLAFFGVPVPAQMRGKSLY